MSEDVVGRGIRWLREAVFPTHCVSCSAFGDWWCLACRSKVELIRRDLCPRCSQIGFDHECKLTIDETDALLATGFYHDPILRSVVTSLKYKGATCLIPSLESYLTSWGQHRTTPWPWAGESELSIQSIPSTPKRIRERGFDQATLIAEAVRRAVVPWAVSSNLLIRRDGTTPQASLAPGPLRHANLRGAFDVTPQHVPHAVLLVDDVFTTGATMKEAARVLREAGVKKLYGFALAVGA